MSQVSATSAARDVHQLRRLWKPHKERLQAIKSNHPTNVQFHRATDRPRSLVNMEFLIFTTPSTRT